MIEGVRFARRLYESNAFGQYFRDERKPGSEVASDADLEACIRQESFLMVSPVRNLQMGSDGAAVVDANLRVHGVQNLWVADASVFPTIPAGNINATSIMVGEKASDLIAADKGRG